MPVKIMVEGGTPKSSVPSLCFRCAYSQVMTDDQMNPHVICRSEEPGRPINYKVVKCSSFGGKVAPSDYLKTGWIFGRLRTTNEKGQYVMSEERNFHPPGSQVA